VIRLAAVGDVHVGVDSASQAERALASVSAQADLLLIAGDLTQHGLRQEGRVLADALSAVTIPVVAVLGNHDYHQGHEAVMRRDLESAGVTVLEGEGRVFEIRGTRVAIGGTKGFGGGFAGACGTEFGEPEMKAFIRHTKGIAENLYKVLAGLSGHIKVALTHFAPINDTLRGERLEIYPFLGSYLLGEAIDRAGCTLALHGHAHLGTERGVTVGGVPVRNVARPVIQRAYKIYTLQEGQRTAALNEAVVG
jgi:Icc-related predicted phosphoesterase